MVMGGRTEASRVGGKGQGLKKPERAPRVFIFIYLPRFDVVRRQKGLPDPAGEDSTTEGCLSTVEDRKQRSRLTPVGLTLQDLPTC